MPVTLGVPAPLVITPTTPLAPTEPPPQPSSPRPEPTDPTVSENNAPNSMEIESDLNGDEHENDAPAAPLSSTQGDIVMTVSHLLSSLSKISVHSQDPSSHSSGSNKAYCWFADDNSNKPR